MYILGLGGPYFHESSACLIDGCGTIIAFAEEERFTRRKHNRDSRSCTQAAAFCLDRAGLRLEDIDQIAVAWNPEWPHHTEEITDAALIKELLDPNYFYGYVPSRLSLIDHHTAHAASAYYLSGFSEAAVLVADGSGDGCSTSLFHGTGKGLKELKRFPYTQSLGWFYETVAEHLGLGDWTNTGKLMGLAAYGKPILDLNFIDTDSPDVEYSIDLLRYGMNREPGAHAEYAGLQYYRDLKIAYRRAFEDLGISVHKRRYDYRSSLGLAVADTRFTEMHANLAASAQHKLQQALLRLCRTALTESGSRNLCLAGGVALNCSANGYLWRQTGADQIFVQPAAGDSGCALGAAMECARQNGMLLPLNPMRHTSYGPEFADDDIRITLKSYHLPITYHGDSIAEVAAHYLSNGKIVAWYQGRAEAGPRALGQRSILADPRYIANRDRINATIKKREAWRPLAPSILGESLKRLVVRPGPSEFMIIAYEASEAAKEAMPATVHADGTMRPQAIPEKLESVYAKLLKAFEAETGVPGVLNTSFNTDSEPIVGSPTDALRTFYSTPIDVLAIGGFLLTKK